MFTNMSQEFATEVSLKVAARAADLDGDPIDCEPDAEATDLGQLQRRYRLVSVTVVVGNIAAGGHRVAVEVSGSEDSGFVEVANTGLLSSDSVRVLTIRRGAGIRYVRLVHKATGLGVVGGIVHRPKLPAASQVDLERLLRHCIYAVGAGAGMPITSDAIEAIALHVRDNFYVRLQASANPLAEWNRVRFFLLACCTAIGERAAEDAKDNALIAIQFARTDGEGNLVGGLAKAYNDVSQANEGGGAGDYCPILD
jgi:hypothetical protein